VLDLSAFVERSRLISCVPKIGRSLVLCGLGEQSSIGQREGITSLSINALIRPHANLPLRRLASSLQKHAGGSPADSIDCERGEITVIAG
jgi:hypothetical protein